MKTIEDILRALKSGELTLDQAEKMLRSLSLAQISNIGLLDLNREWRSGVPEVVLAQTKSIEDLIRITHCMIHKKGVALLTRVDLLKVSKLKDALKDSKLVVYGSQDHHTIIAQRPDWTPSHKGGKIAILTAGTSDIVYAREAEAIAQIMGVDVLTFYDVGVAGIHRLIDPIQKIIEENVDAVVIFAGMEGALPTVVAALIDIPVIGVPVPTGYGYMGEGETALAAMLQSCAPGLAVVNIGNGLGAGAFACIIAKRRVKESSPLE